jgi:hypothetical protein
LSEIDTFYSRTDASWKDTRLPYVRTGDIQIHLAIAALQGALHTLDYLEIPFETLSNYVLCTSWAFLHLPKNLS